MFRLASSVVSLAQLVSQCVALIAKLVIIIYFVIILKSSPSLFALSYSLLGVKAEYREARGSNKETLEMKDFFSEISISMLNRIHIHYSISTRPILRYYLLSLSTLSNVKIKLSIMVSIHQN